MESFLEFFSFNYMEIIAIVVLLFLLGIQLFFYLKYYKLPYTVAIKGEKKEVNAQEDKKVSVIISSENEAFRLSKLLPVILEQDYPNFEVIVISDGSTDETEDVLDSLKIHYKNLYSTFIPYSTDRNFGRRKLAYTLGIKAATGDVLLFVEPHAVPMSKNWMRLMTQEIDERTDVVLGVSYFAQNKTFFNRIARFDNFIFTMQYLSYALLNSPFTGVYRNVAFKKELFFNNKGFSSHLAIENGEDAFINQIVNENNTKVCLDQDAFTESDIDNFSLWKRIKKNYSVARSNFKDKTAEAFNLELISRAVFYVFSIALAVYAIAVQHWGLLIVGVLLFLVRLITQLVVINKGCKYFKSGKYYLSLVVVDILQPLYNIRFRTRMNRIKGLK